MPGLDGQKMSKSYGNTIGLREEPDSVTTKMKRMPTDPARVRLSDPGLQRSVRCGNSMKCIPDPKTKEWVRDGCNSAGIGCLECKQPVIDAVIAEQDQIIARAAPYDENPDMVRSILIEGAEKAEDDARQTLNECVKQWD